MIIKCEDVMTGTPTWVNPACVESMRADGDRGEYWVVMASGDRLAVDEGGWNRVFVALRSEP
jgi:hypothetical protein